MTSGTLPAAGIEPVTDHDNDNSVIDIGTGTGEPHAQPHLASQAAGSGHGAAAGAPGRHVSITIPQAHASMPRPTTVPLAGSAAASTRPSRARIMQAHITASILAVVCPAAPPPTSPEPHSATTGAIDTAVSPATVDIDTAASSPGVDITAPLAVGARVGAAQSAHDTAYISVRDLASLVCMARITEADQAQEAAAGAREAAGHDSHRRQHDSSETAGGATGTGTGGGVAVEKTAAGSVPATGHVSFKGSPVIPASPAGCGLGVRSDDGSDTASDTSTSPVRGTVTHTSVAPSSSPTAHDTGSSFTQATTGADVAAVASALGAVFQAEADGRIPVDALIDWLEPSAYVTARSPASTRRLGPSVLIGPGGGSGGNIAEADVRHEHDGLLRDVRGAAKEAWWRMWGLLP